MPPGAVPGVLGIEEGIPPGGNRGPEMKSGDQKVTHRTIFPDSLLSLDTWSIFFYSTHMEKKRFSYGALFLPGFHSFSATKGLGKRPARAVWANLL